MSAIDSKHLIEIIAVNKESGIAKKSGNPWEMHKAQCIVRGPDGVVKIGELILPKTMADTPPGKYLAGFELDVSFERVVVPRIVELHPWGNPVQPKDSASAPDQVSAPDAPKAPLAEPSGKGKDSEKKAA